MRSHDSDSQNLSFLLPSPSYHRHPEMRWQTSEVEERDRCLLVPHLPTYMPTAYQEKDP